MGYAIVKTGGRQQKVSIGDTIYVDKVSGKAGDAITFDNVLLTVVNDTPKIGTPKVRGAFVTGKIVKQAKGNKVRVSKFRAKSRYRKTIGFRQRLTGIRIEKIGDTKK